MAIGRPTKLTPTVCKAIAKFVADGNFFETACPAAGVTSRVGYQWMARGKREHERVEAGQDPIPEEAPYLHFFQIIEKSRAAPISELTSLLMVEARGGDRKAMEYLLSRLSPPQPPAAAEQPDGLRGLVDVLAKARAKRDD